MKYLVAFVVIFVVGLVLNLMMRLGSFKPVAIFEAEKGPIQIVFKKHVGAYHLIVPVIEEVEKWAKANGETCRLSFGEFLDDPDKTVEDRLRSNGGCIVEKKWDMGLPAGYGYREIPRHLYVQAEFEGAPSIGPIKVYPKVKDYISSHGYTQVGPTYEVYEITSPSSVKTTYDFPIGKK